MELLLETEEVSLQSCSHQEGMDKELEEFPPVIKVCAAPLPCQDRNAPITSSCLNAGLRSEKQVLALENEGTAGAGVYEDSRSEEKDSIL